MDGRSTETTTPNVTSLLLEARMLARSIPLSAPHSTAIVQEIDDRIIKALDALGVLSTGRSFDRAGRS